MLLPPEGTPLHGHTLKCLLFSAAITDRLDAARA